MSFVHLHVHSHYSLLDGLSKVDELVGKAKALNMPALALTDHGVMYGLVEFYQKAKAAGVKPILGVEAYVAPNKHTDKRPNVDARPYHLLIWARNNVGYQNLIKLTTIAHLDGYYYKPRVDHELLEQYREGLMISSACLNGEVARAILAGDLDRAEQIIRWYIETFGKENYVLEVQHHPTLPNQAIVNEAVFKFAKQFGLPVIATCDSHYLNREDATAQDVMLCIQTKKTLADTDRMSYIGEDFSLRAPDEMAEIWHDHPEVLESTLAVADACNVELEFGKTLLPAYTLPPEQTPEQELRRICIEGLERRYGTTDVDPSIMERLNYELDIIQKTGFAGYFLIVQDFINWAKDHGVVVGPGRGSAPGSLVAYLSRITNIDPIKYNLIFERFLNPERISMPDIDTDFADIRRDQVLEYVAQKYGRDHVAQIITFGTMAARASVRDVGRVMGLPYAYCDKISKLIPMFTSLDEAIKTIPELQQINQEPDGKRLLEIARRLEGCVRHASTHACGVVLTPVPMDQVVPRQRSNIDDTEIITQYEMHAVEALGLLKMDFLGLKNLTIIETALGLITEAHGITLDMDNLPLDDAKTFALLQRADTTGVFQLESSGMKRYLKLLKPTELEDIIAMVSLYRPGPMEFIPDYIDAKHGRRKVKYLDPKLKPILEKTYGIAVYQEQIMEIARTLAGFSYGQADVLRKAVGKKIASLLKEQEEKMVAGMIANNIASATAKKIWEFILPFARYGFNRSHAAAYAFIAYQTAYLKANYPAEFMAALLTSDHGNIDRIAIEVEECRQLGIDVLPPDVNESDAMFTVVYEGEGVDRTSKKIRFGLSAVKNLGEQIIADIIAERKANGSFATLADMLSRVKSKDLNKKSIEALIKCGGFDQFGERNQLLMNIDRLLTFVRSINAEADTKQASLFGMLATESVLPKLILEPAEMADEKQKLRWEKELLGLYVTAHPMQAMHGVLAGQTTSIGTILTNQQESETLIVAGVISTLKRVVTKAGELMLFVRVEDATGSIEVVVFPRTLQSSGDVWIEDRIVAINARLSDKDGEQKLICNLVRELTPENAPAVLSELQTAEIPKPNFVRRAPRPAAESAPAAPLPERAIDGMAMIAIREPLTAEQTNQLKALLTQHPGKYQTCILLPNQGRLQKLITPYNIDPSATVQTAVETIVGPGCFRVEPYPGR